MGCSGLTMKTHHEEDIDEKIDPIIPNERPKAYCFEEGSIYYTKNNNDEIIEKYITHNV